MTENAIVKMATKIRNKVGTSRTFTLPEIATLMTVPDNFPDFWPSATLKVNGVTQQGGSSLTVHGGETISFTLSYIIHHAGLLQKLIGSNAHLYLSIPVIKYMDTDFSQKATAQTIHILKKDGSNLLNSVSIAAGSTQYAYTTLQLNQPLSNEIVSYLTTNQPIEVRYDNIASHDNLDLLTSVVLNILLFNYV